MAAARLEEIRREAPLDPDGEHPVAQVMREDRPLIWRDLKEPGVVEQVAQNDDHRQLMDDAGYNSAAVVPLIARGRKLGALSFLHARADLRYDPGDLDFLAELGDRAAMALDNARLYSERARIAESLQRGLRPPRPPRGARDWRSRSSSRPPARGSRSAATSTTCCRPRTAAGS